MKSRPIFFTARMVLALLSGIKTQTRRIAKLPPNACEVKYWAPPSGKSEQGYADPGLNYWTDGGNHLDHCPYGHVGDQLYVRETWQHSNYPFDAFDGDCDVFYRADYLDDVHGPDGENSPEGKYRFWKPSIHMPRAASRITLEIVKVRVERLQDCSDADAIAEGIEPNWISYRSLWESINGAGSWDVNPWVWVIEFRKVAP